METKSNIEILRHLGAFWQHFGIHKRVSDFSGKSIISVFSDKCSYPVWHKDEWLENNNPPSTFYDSKKDFWKQVWDLFKTCPIAHNIGIGNENSEYTDDCWYSKNCYLCHSLAYSQDVIYGFRVVKNYDTMFCVFSFDLKKCVDVIYGFDSYNIKYGIDIKRCKNSSFLFDCEDCEDCFFCYNLRNKKYCIGNKQLTKEEYFKELEKYNLSSRNIYEKLKSNFGDLITKNAWWKNLHFNSVENCNGNYLDNCNNCNNCFNMELGEDCENGARSYGVKSSKNFISAFESEKIYNSTLAQGNCYNINCCFNVIKSKNLEYCSNCDDCEDCFLCSGLLGKRYYILNKEYSELEYIKLKEEIISDMKDKGIYGDFFPAYFSPTSYEESLSGAYCSLDKQKQKELGFNVFDSENNNNIGYKSLADLPDYISNLTNTDFKGGYWDDIYKRPFQVTDLDINFSNKLGVPLNDRFYIRRLKENLSWMFPSFELRETICVKSGKKIKTTLPKKLDSRIVSLEEYEKIVY